ncbi:MAG: hypothetical protein JW787_07540 [Sedimentisphaerales bacterium]|nr:hypothetical protein [Sedimentisphaerales bacterium]
MKQNSKDKLILVVLIFLVSLPLMPLLIQEIVQPPLRGFGIEVKITALLHKTHTAILEYFEKNGKYPPAENWQDLLLPYFDNEKDVFTLPSKSRTKNTIALNPNAKPDSPKDVVLLFESTGGWNAHGQAESLAPTSNGKPGCFVVFNDGQIKFIKPEQTKDLNWGIN